MNLSKSKNKLCLTIGVLFLLFAATACNQKPATESKPVPSPQAPAPVVQKVSEEIKETYQWYCAQCHGIEGKGNGINARLLTVMPRNHTEPEYLETRSDDDLFRAIKLGGVAVGRAPCMPRWGLTLDDDTIHGLVQYIRELCQCKAS